MTTSAQRTWPFPRETPLDPPPEFAKIRDETPACPIRLWNGSPAWLLTRHADVKAALADSRMSSDVTRPHFPSPDEVGSKTRGRMKSFIRFDPPIHDEHRAMLAGQFTLRHIKELSPYITELAGKLMDEIAAGPKPVDLVEQFAAKIPAYVTCKLLGLPEEHQEMFHRWINAWMDLESPADVAAAAAAETLDYFAGVVEQRSADPGPDDLTGRLVRNHLHTGDLTKEQMRHMLHLLLLAGFDTTRNMIGLGTLTLLLHQDQLAELKADPQLWPGAIEELLRYLTIVYQVGFRQAKEDMELGGACIRANDAVVASIQAANRDPDVFPDPDRFDIHRNARQHVAFGFGVHQCLGQPLARAEMRIVFPMLFARFPGLRLAIPESQVRYSTQAVYGVVELPLTW